MRRLALYVFWEKDGIVRNYVTYYLEALKSIADKVVVIVNGKLSEPGARRFQEIQVDFFTRKNQGRDFEAWKAALEREGWEQVRAYDELILCNCSCYGPVYPFTGLFDAMHEHECDFWGLYRHPAVKDLFPAYLQSYFLVIRKKLLCSQAFFHYWKALAPTKDRKKTGGAEKYFTQYFEEKGFSSRAYIENCESMELVDEAPILLPHKLVSENTFPVVRRKAFNLSYQYFFSHGNVSQGEELIKVIKQTSFPIEYVYEDILQTMQASDIRKILHHTFVLPDSHLNTKEIPDGKVAIIVFSYFEDLVDENISYMQSMPPESDAYIVVISEDVRNIWEQKKAALPNKNVFIRTQVNRGRNENAYWLTCKDVIETYDFICVAHDKKTLSASPRMKGYYFNKHCWDNILKSRDYVLSVLTLMAERPEIGILMPPVVSFAAWGCAILRDGWGRNRKIAWDIYERLNMHIPFEKHPDGPWGSMFWLRGKAMAPFYRYEWTVEDFPEEPLCVSDGTVLHALERMYPMIVQEAGYFSAWIMPSSVAGIQFDNMFYLTKAYSLLMNSFRNVHFGTIKNLIKLYIKKKWEKIMKKFNLL